MRTEQLLAGAPQAFRPQQAADVLGVKRRIAAWSRLLLAHMSSLIVASGRGVRNEADDLPASVRLFAKDVDAFFFRGDLLRRANASHLEGPRQAHDREIARDEDVLDGGGSVAVAQRLSGSLSERRSSLQISS